MGTVKANIRELAGNLFDRETLREVAFASSRMVPVLALGAVGSVVEDMRQGEGISRGTKLGIAGFAANLAVGTAATIESQR
jgi:hypothetical protein